MEDSFIHGYIGDLLRSLRTQYLIDLIKPYTRVELTFLAKVDDFGVLFLFIRTDSPDSNSTSSEMRWKTF